MVRKKVGCGEWYKNNDTNQKKNQIMDLANLIIAKFPQYLNVHQPQNVLN